jgi:hypothetical protein
VIAEFAPERFFDPDVSGVSMAGACVSFDNSYLNVLGLRLHRCPARPST